jgi:AcrR family transcriptional regulator
MRDVYPQNTREAILDATDRLLACYGYKKMTIDDLAHEVGIGKGSVYLHFSSKEEIALSHVDRIIERLKSRLRSIASKDATATDRLQEMLVERVTYRFDSVQHYSQSLNEMLSSIRAKMIERRKRYLAQEARIFAGVVEDGQRLGEFAGNDPTDLTHTLLSATNSLLPYSLSVSELGNRDDVADRAAKTARLLIKGMAL